MKTFEELKVKMGLSIGYTGASRNDEVYLSEWIDEETWSEMNESEKEKFLNDCIEDWAWNYIDIGGGLA